MRQSKTVNGVTTTHVYDGANIVADLGATDKFYVRGAGLALFKDGTTTQVYGINPRGDVTKLISTDGTVADFSYTAYGEITSPATTTANPFGYTGEYTDAETGLVYLRNRYYDPEIGIFITEDPAKDGTNWYAYCAGNPIMFVDPWGYAWTEKDEEVYQKICDSGQATFAETFKISINIATEEYNAANGDKGKQTLASLSAAEVRKTAYAHVGITYIDKSHLGTYLFWHCFETIQDRKRSVYQSRL